jgi:hypothetical protein
MFGWGEGTAKNKPGMNLFKLLREWAVSKCIRFPVKDYNIEAQAPVRPRWLCLPKVLLANDFYGSGYYRSERAACCSCRIGFARSIISAEPSAPTKFIATTATETTITIINPFVTSITHIG